VSAAQTGLMSIKVREVQVGSLNSLSHSRTGGCMLEGSPLL